MIKKVALFILFCSICIATTFFIENIIEKGKTKTILIMPEDDTFKLKLQGAVELKRIQSW